MNDLRAQLREILQGRAALVGVGQVGQGDDGLGVRLAERLRDLRFTIYDLRVFVAGCEPEHHLAELTRGGFDNVLFLDAVEFGGEPGAVVLLNASEMAARCPQISTHQLSLGLLARLIEAGGASKAWLLGVQPESLREGTALSPTVQQSVNLLADLLAELAAESSSSTPAGGSRPGSVRRASVLECGGPPPLWVDACAISGPQQTPKAPPESGGGPPHSKTLRVAGDQNQIHSALPC